jgi:hypothetical protein
LRNELMVSVRSRNIFEDAPLQAFTHRLWVGGGKKGRKPDDAASRFGGCCSGV